MATRNAIIKRNNSGTIDTIHPETTWDQVKSKPATYTATAHTHPLADISNVSAGTLVEATAGTVTGNRTWSPLILKQSIEALSDLNTNNYLTGVSGSGNGTVTFTRQGLTSLTWNASHTHNYLSSIDDRTLKPNDLSYNRTQTYFSSLGGLTGTDNSDYQDLLILNTYTDSSGGDANLLAFDKSEQKIRHYLADQTATTWGTPKTLAYSEDVVALSGNQTIAGTKTFSSTIAGTTNGNLTSSSSLNPANITQSASYRFVSDTEKSTWNAKEPAIAKTEDGLLRIAEGTFVVDSQNYLTSVTSHASATTTYGAATTSNYGHVRLSYPGSANSGAMMYNGSTKASGRFYQGTTSPSNSTRLNYDGYLYAKKLYSEGTEVSVTGHNHSHIYAQDNSLTVGSSAPLFFDDAKGEVYTVIHEGNMSTTANVYNSTRWGNKQLRVGSYSSGVNGYITMGY